MKDIIDILNSFADYLLILTVAALLFILGYVTGYDGLIQKLCNQQQYDFCEVIEQQPKYKLKG